MKYGYVTFKILKNFRFFFTKLNFFFSKATDVVCCTASIYLVLVISIDRYVGVSLIRLILTLKKNNLSIFLLQITRPLGYNQIVTKRRIFLSITLVWILSLIVSLAPQIGWKSPQNTSRCDVNDDKYYALFSASVSFYIPLLIILVVYYRIYKEAKAQMEFLKKGTKQTKSNNPGSEVTLRVHIGPTKSMKIQYCECKEKFNSNRIIEEPESSFEKKKINVNTISENNNNNGISNKFLNVKNLKTEQHMISNLRASSESSLKIQKNVNFNGPLICKNCKFSVKKAISTDVLHKASSKGNMSGSTNLSFSSKLAKFKKEQKAAKTLAIVVGCFILCWMPFFLILPIDAFCSSNTCKIPKLVFDILFWLGYCNSAINPFIYCCSSREFRTAYMGILKCNLKYRNAKEREKLLKLNFKTNYKNANRT